MVNVSIDAHIRQVEDSREMPMSVSAVEEFLSRPVVGHIHGVVTIACIVAVGLSALKFRARPTLRRVGWGLFSGAVTFLFLVGTTTHMCLRGTPDFYVVYAAVNVPVLVITCGVRLVRRPFPGLLLLVFPLLAFHYVVVVHESGFTGNPKSAEVPQRAFVKEARTLAAGSTGEVPQGFLSDALSSGAWKPAPAADDPLCAVVRKPYLTRRAVRQWYTCFTGLWRTEAVSAGLWTPGGKLCDVAGRIELRELDSTLPL